MNEEIILKAKKQIAVYFKYGVRRIDFEDRPLQFLNDIHGRAHILLSRHEDATLALVGGRAIRVRADSVYMDLFKQMAKRYHFRVYVVKRPWVNVLNNHRRLFGGAARFHYETERLQNGSSIEIDGIIYKYPNWEAE